MINNLIIIYNTYITYINGKNIHWNSVFMPMWL